MGLFSRQPSVDAHLAPLTTREADHLRRDVVAAFAEHGSEVVDRGDHVADADGGVYGLHNLAMLCASLPPRERPGAIRSHVAALVDSRSTSTPVTLADIERAGYVRAMDLAAVPDGIRDELTPYSRRVGDSLIALLTLDAPSAVTTVGPDDLARLDLRAAWSAGMANLRAVEVDAREQQDVDGCTVHSLAGESFFVGSRILVLEDEVARVGDAPHGAVVIAPDRHHLHFHVVRDISVVAAVNLLAKVAGGAYAQEPGAISPHVYWWRTGALTPLTQRRDDGALTVVPPDDFVTLLNRLAGEAP
ncbi:hypothetical protein [Demequina sp. NBRC 110053]|uniref:hypothetical protein n=1 Tax=Demequina sp. NBRC 110053 TaxID=1570342 RepID=UPI000A076D1E|nr:hypothetical protein [Demequina sp. NBRC 110053]